MPIAKVQMPDGRIGRFEVPEGTTEQQVLDFVQSVQDNIGEGADITGDFSPSGASWGAGQNFASGVLQGMGDEVMAATAAAKESLGGGLSFGNAYDQAKSMYQRARAGYAQENPVTAFATDVAGQTLPWVAAAPLSPAIGAASLAGRIGQGAAQGAVTGAISGGLNAEGEVSDRVTGSGVGAIIGGGLGGATVPIVEGLSGVGRKIIDAVNKRRAGVTPADKKIGAIIANIGKGDIEAGWKEVNKRLSEGGPDTALVDVLGIKGAKLARAAANVAGDGGQITDDFVMERAMGRGERLQTTADYLAPRENLVNKTEALLKKRGEASGALYKSAFVNNPQVESAEINKLLATPAGKTALRKAVETMQNDLSRVSTVDPELTAALKEAVDIGLAPDGQSVGGVGRGFKLRTLDYVKQSLYDLGEAAKDANRRPTGASRAIHGLRVDLTKELDRLDVTARAGAKSFKAAGGDYANARAANSAVSREIDAIPLGEGFMKGNVDVTASVLSKMSPDEKAAFRTGARNALREMINTDTQSAVNKLADKKAGIWGKLRMAFPDSASFAKFRMEIDAEAKKALTDNFISPRAGSKTAGLTEDINSLSTVPEGAVDAAGHILKGNYFSALNNLAGGVRDKFLAPNEKTAGQIARSLTETTQPARSAHLSRIVSQPSTAPLSADDKSKIIKRIISMAVPAATPAVNKDPLVIDIRNRRTP